MNTPETPRYHLTIRDMPANERPRERLRDYGASALSNAELLAIALRTGTSAENVISVASRLLSQYGGLAGLSRADFRELCNQHGVGEAKASQIKAALELGRRLVITQPEERATISSPQDVYNLLAAEMAHLEQEHLRVLLLDTRHRVTAMPELYKGNVNSSVVRVAEVFRDAIRQTSPALIVVHNHPSGDPAPSSDDIAVTRQLVAASELLDIEVLDHIVIGEQGFVSMRERGLGFEATQTPEVKRAASPSAKAE